MSRLYWDLVNTFPTIRSFLAARLLQEVDAGNRVAVSVYNDVLGWLNESDRQQAEAMTLTDAEHVEHADLAEREFARAASERDAEHSYRMEKWAGGEDDGA